MAVEPIANDWAAEPGKVDTNLVGAARERLNFEQARLALKSLGIRRRRRQQPPAGGGPLAEHDINPLPRRPVTVGGQWQMKLSAGVGRLARHYGKVGLGHLAPFKGPAEGHAGHAGAGQDQETGGVAVEPVHRLERTKKFA